MKKVPKRAKITYRSAQKNIATVSKQGKVKGIKSGTTKITISVKKDSKTTKLTYKVTVKKPKLSKSKLSLKSGNATQLSVKNKPKKAKYTWQSSNSKVATVNKNGKVVAKAKGTANIRVKVKTTKKTYSLSCKVTVKSTYDVKQTYTITFDSNGGSIVASQTVEKNTLATRPIDPTRNGYTFDGWFTVASGGKKFDFNTAVTSNINLYAHWTAIQSQEPTPTPVTYTVMFDSNGGSTIASQTVEKNTLATRPTDPTRNGYSFDGWFTVASGGKKFDFNTAVTSNITLYAHWTAIQSQEPTPTPVTYTVTFDSNGGSTIASQTVEKNTLATRPTDPTRSGYTFDGWFTAASGGKKFDFNTAVTSNVTLYAHWQEDSVNQSDVTDSNKDGVPDWVEREFGANPTLDDTDGDGISDADEIFILNSNPTKMDSDGNGISDADEDYDLDGIINIIELSNDTNPVSADTDGDGIIDSDEIKYGTNPIEVDSDGDGANDNWEIANNYNPLVPNKFFNAIIQPAAPSTSCPVTAGVETSAPGYEASTLSVTEVNPKSNAFISSSIAGYLGSAFEFDIDGNIEIATITFNYDTSLGTISDAFQPRIYYINEETDSLEELENQIVSDGVVTAQVSHFSKYILLNKIDFDKVWDTEIKPPIISDGGNDAALDIAFVVDYSLSMDWNDPNKLFKELSKGFISKLRDGIDQATVVKFIKRATVVSNLTTDKNLLNSSIDNIKYDDGYGSYSGTDGSTGIKAALDELATSESKYKYMLFITDGEDNEYTFSYDDLISTANDMGVVIYTVGMGSASESILKKVAESTGGAYYHATTDKTDVDSNDIFDLEDVYKDIESNTIDLTTDSNNDGIPDYYNSLIISGELVTANGSDEFSGIDFNYDKNGNLSYDYDGDGLKNGEELIITQKENRVFMKMKSSPIVSDTDDDGINDKQDSAPTIKGLENGIVGKLSLVSCYNTEDSGWTSGHVFFVYTSYIKDTVNFSTLAAGWSKKDTSGKWTWDNLKQNNPLLSNYSFAVGESATVGNGAFGSGWFGIGDGSGSSGSSGGSGGDSSDSGVGDENGVCYNMEVYKHLKEDIGYSYLDNTYISEDITEQELNDLIAYCSKGSVNYWNLTHNCAEVACQAWNLISDIKVNPYSSDFMWGKIATPKGLKINLRTISNSAKNYSLASALNP